jgi:hypothetical protein
MLNMNTRHGPITSDEICNFSVGPGKPSRGKYRGMIMVRWRNGSTGSVNVYAPRIRDLRDNLVVAITRYSQNGDWHREAQGLEPLYGDVWQ